MAGELACKEYGLTICFRVKIDAFALCCEGEIANQVSHKGSVTGEGGEALLSTAPLLISTLIEKPTLIVRENVFHLHTPDTAEELYVRYRQTKDAVERAPLASSPSRGHSRANLLSLVAYSCRQYLSGFRITSL